MSVPRTFPALLRPRIAAVLMLLATSPVSYAKGPEPTQRLPLQAMGYQQPGAGMMASIGNMSTLHFIDDEHLLVTFAVRRLMKRLADDPADDQDRTVEAVVVHLPSGKVLARTSWRMHDSSQYIWSLGHGRFLLRQRDKLTTIMPLAGLKDGEAFTEQPFITSGRKLAAILVSPDRDLLTVETVDMPPPAAVGSPATQQASPQNHRAQLNFYRIIEPIDPADRVIVQSAGVAVAAGLVNLSITSSGYIEVSKETSTRWLFDFDPYAGKFVELSPFDSSCRPRPVFVSASEFVAFGCRGTDDKLTLGGFNMKGDQMWQQNFSDTHAYPNFAFAPSAGRFALSRNIVSSIAGMTAEFAPTDFTMQEIRVYQTYNGKQLLRVEASPVERSGQNYDLSSDGRQLAVLKEGAVELHRLPALTSGDEIEVRAAKVLKPEDVHASVNLLSHVRPPGKPGAPLPASVATPAPVFVPETLPPAAVAATPTVNGDRPVGETRKPPTLYTLPTDKPEERPH